MARVFTGQSRAYVQLLAGLAQLSQLAL
jgi:hypothetical protein